MCTNCAVFVANLFCFASEYDFIVQLVNANWVVLVSKFSSTARYIDDLFCIDNNLLVIIYVLVRLMIKVYMGFIQISQL